MGDELDEIASRRGLAAGEMHLQTPSRRRFGEHAFQVSVSSSPWRASSSSGLEQ